MKKYIFYYLLVFMGIMLIQTGCSDDAPVGDYFADEQYNARGTVITPSNVVNGFFDLGDLDNSSIAFDLAQTGEAASSVSVLANYNGGGFSEVTSVSSLPTTVTVNANDVISALGLDANSIAVGDVIVMVFDATSGGGTYRSSNTLSAPFSCLSALAGTYNYASTNYWCAGPDLTGEVTIIETGAGTYSFDDWSFGSYGNCYGGFGTWGSLSMNDVCNKISLSGEDNYGDTWELTINSVSGADLDLTWTNTYGEYGTTVLTRTDGTNWPPLSN
ncbi:MAG: hypothetical protein HKN67_11935 [Saprospiraceae bacterium]|nr:hypothetical protein [Saprospiraceae bacterium]